MYVDYKEKLNMIKDATFVSVWDGGTKIISSCKINTETNEVFDIESVDCDVDILDREYIIIDGTEYDVYSEDEADANEFWHY